MNRTQLEAACAASGIATSYLDGEDRRREPSPDALEAILSALGGPDPNATKPIIVAANVASHRAVPAGVSAVTITLKGGETQRLELALGLVAIPALPNGYHSLTLEKDGVRRQVPLLATPARTHMPSPWPRGKAWGLQAQLYGLRNQDGAGRDKPIGDLGDLARLGVIAQEAGASFVGINPLHAVFPERPDARSPYSPSSRIFLNPLYLDLDQVPGAASEPQRSDDLLVDYPAAWAAKSAALKSAYAAFPGDAGFDAWRQAQGAPLERHSVFEALSAAHDGAAWTTWATALQDPASPGVAAFGTEHADAVTYAAWLQWHCARQLERAAEATPGFGLYRDLAVGADRAGSEYWGAQDLFAGGLDIGAPPDAFSPGGQNWGLPPIKPAMLSSAAGIAHIRALIGSNMSGSGLLRIDHAFQLARLFLVPHGFENADGAYVAYPFDLLVAILKIESHRHRCIVVAEDLGTQPEGFGDAIAAAGLLNYKVFYFERDGVRFTDPEGWSRTSFASISTHDLPTLRGWWTGHDIDWRERAGRVDAAASIDARHERGADRRALRDALSLPLDGDAPVGAIISHVASAGSMLVGVQLEDIAGDVEQANLPGTLDEHPNWRRRLGATLEEVRDGIVRTGEVMAAAGRDGTARMPFRATYRLQFHEGFTFADAEAILPYLAELGVSQVYASPIMEAEPGSTHGYDGIDPTRISEALGGAEGFASLAKAARSLGLGIVIDIVPNHLGVASEANPFWWSVMAEGRRSRYAAMFDIDWPRHGPDRGKVLLPVLGEGYGSVLASGALSVVATGDGTAFELHYGDRRFPISAESHLDILQFAPDIDPGADLSAVETDTLAKAAAAITRTGRFGAGGALHALLEKQHYRLMHWRAGTDTLNYRRFFDINTLIGLRVEDPEVLELVHREVFRLYHECLIDGVRIDHVDGLADPGGYLERLRKRLGPDAYIVVEKILEDDEALPSAWPIDGTSGYDGLNAINGLLVDRDALETFDALEPATEPFGERLRAAKAQMLDASFRGEVSRLVSTLLRIARRDLATRDITRGRMQQAVRELLIAMPVYRTYVGDHPDASDRAVLDTAFAKADDVTRGALADVLQFVRGVLDGEGGTARTEALRRFQQLGGPVMAKGLEDTLFYRDARLISLDEVGGAPQTFGHGPDRLHDWAIAQARDWPGGMIATATHDTKRGEDGRARISALTHVPGLWLTAVQELDALHTGSIVDETDRRIFYQAVAGAWSEDDGQIDRLKAYAEKALREAKRHSIWTEPNAAYEAAAAELMAELGDRATPSGRLIASVVERVDPIARNLSLVQLVLKHLLPGVPDTYQGTERFDWSLVDPDNRRPVVYDALQAALRDGDDVKISTTARLLAFGRALHPLLVSGTYEPIDVENGVGFRRLFGDMVCEVAVPLRFGPDGEAVGFAAALSPDVSAVHEGGTAWAEGAPVLLRLNSAALAALDLRTSETSSEETRAT